MVSLFWCNPQSSTFWDLKLFQFFGLLPLPLKPGHEIHIFYNIWSLLHILTSSTIAYFTYVNKDLIIHPTDNIGKVHDLFKLASSIAAHHTILVESVLRRRSIQEFFRKYQSLHDNFPVESLPNIQFSRKLYIFITYLLISAAISLHKLYNDQRVLVLSFITLWSHIPTSFHYFQSVLFFEFVRSEIIQLNRQLNQLVPVSTSRDKGNSSRALEGIVIKGIVEGQKRYEIIYEMVQLLNEFFGISWIMGVFSSAISLEYNLYWIWWSIYNGLQHHVYGICGY